MKLPGKNIGITLIVMETPLEGGYSIYIKAPPDYHRLLNGVGIRSILTGKSGWEALMKMAQNWKNARFLD